jgi:hypothetical protein
MLRREERISKAAMLLVTLGLLLGAAALLWCFVLALTYADGNSTGGDGFNRRLAPSSHTDQTTGRSRPCL